MISSELNNNKIYPSGLLILLFVLLLISACTAEREIINTDELIKISKPRVFANTFKNGLYKASMQIQDRELTGLMFFNKKDSSFRVVMLSEVGLKYFDVEYVIADDHQFIVHQIINFMNYDKVVNSLNTFLDLLIIDNNQAFKTYKVKNRSGYLQREIRDSGIKISYLYNANSGAIEQITQSGKNKSSTSLKAYDYLAPGEINYMQGKINFSLVKVEKE